MQLNLKSNSHLNILLKIILNTYLLNPSCILYYYDDSQVHEIKMAGVPIISTKAMDNFIFPADYNCNTFLLQRGDAKEAFETVERILKIENDIIISGKYNKRKYLIIVYSHDALTVTSFSLTFVRDMLVILAPPGNCSQFEMYTHKYIGQTRQNEPILLDTWYVGNYSFAYGSSLFPDKVFNQYGRDLRVTCYNSINLELYCDRDSPLGSEYNIIIIYAKKFNFSLNMYEIDEPYFVPDYDAEDHYRDISFGSLDLELHVDGIESISCKYEVSVPISKLQYGYFMFLEVFKWEVWMLITLAVISICGLVLFQRKCVPASKFRFLTLFGYLVNQPTVLSSDVRKSRLLKWILMLLLFFNMLLVTAYNSRLASVMVSPIYENDINTLDELAQSDLKLMFFDQIYKLFENDTSELYQKLYGKAVIVIGKNTTLTAILTKTDEMFASGEYAVVRYRRMSGEYNDEPMLLDQMYLHQYKPIKPDLWFDQYYIILRRNSMHTIELRRLIRTATETGLMSIWEADARRHDDEDAVLYQQKIQEYPVKKPSLILQLQHFKGIFTFWACGMVIGVVVFFKELLS